MCERQENHFYQPNELAQAAVTSHPSMFLVYNDLLGLSGQWFSEIDVWVFCIVF